MAGDERVELPPTESKSGVLPLHQSPILAAVLKTSIGAGTNPCKLPAKFCSVDSASRMHRSKTNGRFRGTAEGTRTPDPLLRRQLLYPPELQAHMERVMGIEPTRPAWKAGILPLNYTRMD